MLFTILFLSATNEITTGEVSAASMERALNIIAPVTKHTIIGCVQKGYEDVVGVHVLKDFKVLEISSRH